MSKYLVAYQNSKYADSIKNKIVEWDCISEENIMDFEAYDRIMHAYDRIIAITKLDK